MKPTKYQWVCDYTCCAASSNFMFDSAVDASRDAVREHGGHSQYVYINSDDSNKTYIGTVEGLLFHAKN